MNGIASHKKDGDGCDDLACVHRTSLYLYSLCLFNAADEYRGSPQQQHCKCAAHRDQPRPRRWKAKSYQSPMAQASRRSQSNSRRRLHQRSSRSIPMSACFNCAGNWRSGSRNGVGLHFRSIPERHRSSRLFPSRSISFCASKRLTSAPRNPAPWMSTRSKSARASSGRFCFNRRRPR